MSPSNRAPASPNVWLAGALVFALVGATACERGADTVPAQPEVLDLGGDTIEIAADTRVVTVQVRVLADGNELTPALAEAAPGDLVRFHAGDARMHAIAFDSGVLPSAAAAFLQQSGQMRGPPLVDEGNAWVVSFENAPLGDYPYTCVTHGARGIIRIGSGPD